jgi:hypothetical protein
MKQWRDLDLFSTNEISTNDLTAHGFLAHQLYGDQWQGDSDETRTGNIILKACR